MKTFRFLIAALLLCMGALPVSAAETIGVVMMHGKNPGSAEDPGLVSIVGAMQKAGMTVVVPDMPWSKRRYIDADWADAMKEIGAHVAKLRSNGASRVILAGHSFGCPAAMGYAAAHGGVDGLVLLAPGHVPAYFYKNFSVIKESVERAREMVSRGQGDLPNQAYSDINQGRPLTVFTTPRIFLSYFDPASDAEMGVTAPRIPPQVPVMWVIGDQDPLFKAGRGYVFDKLPANPKSRYLEVSANHLTTPAKSADAVLAWIAEAVGK